MMAAQDAIVRLRRDLTLGTAVNAVLGLMALVCLVLPIGAGGFAGAVLLTVVGALWLALSYQSLKGTRLAAASPMLIAAGRLEAAEEQIEAALRTFSLFRDGKLLSVYHLAMLRHAQKRWQDCIQLSRELLKQRSSSLKHVERQSRLMLADALLEMGDVASAYPEIARLYSERLTLAEALKLVAVQVDYESRIGAWGRLLECVATKSQMAELMSAPASARVQALLALAARKMGRADWSAWLRRRAELLADVNDLGRARPALWELWSAEADSRTDQPALLPSPGGRGGNAAQPHDSHPIDAT